MRSAYGNDTYEIRAHFARVKETYGEVRGLGLDRFQALYRCFNPIVPDIKRVCDILHKTFER